MARHKNINWILPEGNLQSGGIRAHEKDNIIISLLMDVRDELQELNKLLGCYRFREIPTTLNKIARNTAKPIKKRKTKSSQ